MPPFVKKCFHVVRLASIFSLYIVGNDTLYARSGPDQPPEYCTVFHHMVKSAGSTIKSTLRSASRREGLPFPGLCIDGPNSIPPCQEAFNSSAVITGYAELMRTPLEAVRKNCEYFTLLRHPIDRLVSAFFYCPLDHDRQLRPLKFCGHADHPVPATERLLEFAQIYWQNMAFKQMTFGMYCFPDLICEPNRVGAAPDLGEPGGLDVVQEVESILAGYTAVGIMEHWELSMQLFNARVRSPVRYWNMTVLSNAGLRSGLRDEVLQWAHDSPEVHRVVGTDMLLYSYALSIFKHQTTVALGTNWLGGGSQC